MQRLAEAQAGTDLTALENRLGGVEAQVQSLRADLAASSGQLGSLKSQLSSLQAEVQALKSQAPAGNLARKVQTNFLLSITGVLLGVAAVAMAIFW
jgi:fluoride ion exporter CrcB/FEX